jgi:hypothetical protein
MSLISMLEKTVGLLYLLKLKNKQIKLAVEEIFANKLKSYMEIFLKNKDNILLKDLEKVEYNA